MEWIESDKNIPGYRIFTDEEIVQETNGEMKVKNKENGDELVPEERVSCRTACIFRTSGKYILHRRFTTPQISVRDSGVFCKQQMMDFSKLSIKVYNNFLCTIVLL